MKLLIKISTFFAIIFTSISIAYGAASSAYEIKPIKVGENIPDVAVLDKEGSEQSLKSISENKSTLFIFFRGEWCPYCNLHLAELQKIEKKLKDLGVQIVALTPDKPEKIAPNIEKNKLTYSIYSDRKMLAAEGFGVAFWIDDATHGALLNFGVDLKEESGEHRRLLPVPAAFLVDKLGKIKFAYANPDYKVRVDTDKLLSEAEKLLAE